MRQGSCPGTRTAPQHAAGGRTPWHLSLQMRLRWIRHTYVRIVVAARRSPAEICACECESNKVTFSQLPSLNISHDLRHTTTNRQSNARHRTYKYLLVAHAAGASFHGPQRHGDDRALGQPLAHAGRRACRVTYANRRPPCRRSCCRDPHLIQIGPGYLLSTPVTIGLRHQDWLSLMPLLQA